jgi:hypothetical protein
MFPQSETAARVEILTRTWKLLERQFDADILHGALAGTSALTLPQLEMACLWLTKNPPKGPILAGILGAVDAASRAVQRRQDASKDLWCLPTVTINQNRSEEQQRILERFKKPATHARWDDAELATIYGELEADSPALGPYRQAGLKRLERFAKTGRTGSA